LIDVSLLVNGQAVSRNVDERLSLLRLLRDDLGLCGTKEGCSTGDCGSCVVLVDGKPEDACLFNLRRSNGIRVDTIESLCHNGGPLHPLQAAFLECGAVQCGFCIPGMILTAKALLDRNPSPSEAEIRTELKDVICRCTGYVQIFEAVQKAAHWMANPAEFARWTPRQGPMGVSAVLVDGIKSVTGQLHYADDLTREGMLFGQIVWSGHPHAEILNIDVSTAQKAPGTVRVFTHKDVPGLNGHGRTTPDQPVFCHDRVRYTGDLIALVVAKTRRQAEDAAKLVTVDYRPLPGLYSPEESLRDGAIQLHPSGNVCKHLVHTVGDVDAAFQSASHVVEGHFSTQRVDHAYLEPVAALAEVVDGVVTINVPQQAPFETREQLVKVLDLPKEQVRIKCTPLGGAFGGKLEISIEAAIAVAVYHLRKPVKITLSREENLHNGVKRHAYEMDYRVAADSDGRLLAVDAKLVSDAGPYTGNSPRVIDQACIFSCGPYRVPNVRIEGLAVLTNNANGGAFRGYGINQAAVAMEQLIDELALKLGKDPFEIRRINMLEEGDVTITGQWLPASVGAIPTLDACKKAFEEEWPKFQQLARPGYKIGYGIAAGYKNVGAGKGKVDDSGATFTLLPNGKVELRASVVDMGQAIRTTMLQLACQATGLAPGRFQLITADTLLTYPHRSASGERQTLISGNAVVMAGKKFKQKLLEVIGNWVGRPSGELTWENEAVRVQWSQYREEEVVMTLDEAAARAANEGVVIQADAVYVSPKTYPLSDLEAKKRVPREEYRNYPTYAYATQAAIVEIEEATGQVKLLHMIAAHDVGVAINPQQIRGQLIGSIVMSQGYTLTEDYPMKDGRPPHKMVTFGRLGLPLSTDAPSVRIEIVEDPFPEGPYGAKGISEIATVPTPPAILNAIYNASGIRLRSIPVDRNALKKAATA
jgi:CO/xanthine dehydrogenase Mo-binding subunit/aerobic-type carbon monoxide dehydrogenase small subunit (CoxS/CutS family)